MKCAPLLVPSFNLIVPPVVTLLPINNSSIALLESTIKPDEILLMHHVCDLIIICNIDHQFLLLFDVDV